MHEHKSGAASKHLSKHQSPDSHFMVEKHGMGTGVPPTPRADSATEPKASSGKMDHPGV